MKSKQSKKKSVTISCKAQEAEEIFVAGTFNEWNPGDIPLKRLKNGTWNIRLSLEPGDYEYKFIVDGKWCCAPDCEGDHSCPNCILNDLGTMNRVLKVE